MRKRSKFLKIGYYISLLAWACGVCFVVCSNAAVGTKIAVILITLGIYIFFVIADDVTRLRRK